jgi:hypothetical protein
MEIAGTGATGAVYAAVIEAVSDEVLLDRQVVPQTSGTSGQAAGDVLTALTTRVDASRFQTAVTGQTVALGQFAASAGASWSRNAAELARMSRTAYRVVNGTVSLTPVGATVHALSETDGSLNLSALTVAEVKTLANDMTVCGEVEPVAYVTEYFQGDGLTVEFDLTHMPFEPAAGRAKPLVELFQKAAVDTRVVGK